MFSIGDRVEIITDDEFDGALGMIRDIDDTAEPIVYGVQIGAGEYDIHPGQAQYSGSVFDFEQAELALIDDENYPSV